MYRPTGAEIAEMELTRQQAIDAANRVAENETQEVIIVHRTTDSHVLDSCASDSRASDSRISDSHISESQDSETQLTMCTTQELDQLI